MQDKLLIACGLKEKIMKFYGIKDHKDVYGFKCQACHAVFDQPTALGGHMSKAHPNYKKEKQDHADESVD